MTAWNQADVDKANAKKVSGRTETPPADTSPPEAIKDTSEESGSIVAPENAPKPTGPPCYAEATGLLRTVFYNPTPELQADLRALAAKHGCLKMGLSLMKNI